MIEKGSFGLSRVECGIGGSGDPGESKICGSGDTKNGLPSLKFGGFSCKPKTLCKNSAPFELRDGLSICDLGSVEQGVPSFVDGEEAWTRSLRKPEFSGGVPLLLNRTSGGEC